MVNTIINRFGNPLSKVIALDKNICIYINNNTNQKNYKRIKDL